MSNPLFRVFASRQAAAPPAGVRGDTFVGAGNLGAREATGGEGGWTWTLVGAAQNDWMSVTADNKVSCANGQVGSGIGTDLSDGGGGDPDMFVEIDLPDPLVLNADFRVAICWDGAGASNNLISMTIQGTSGTGNQVREHVDNAAGSTLFQRAPVAGTTLRLERRGTTVELFEGVTSVGSGTLDVGYTGGPWAGFWTRRATTSTGQWAADFRAGLL